GVDHLAGALTDAADRGDATLRHADVGAEARQAGAIDHRAVLDHQVVRHARSPPWVGGCGAEAPLNHTRCDAAPAAISGGAPGRRGNTRSISLPAVAPPAGWVIGGRT